MMLVVEGVVGQNFKAKQNAQKRIANEIIVDCYGPAEQAMGWYNYLDD